MSIKNIALISAAAAITASGAFANNFFEASNQLDDSTRLSLGTVTTEAAGTVEIYDFSKGTQGALLGTTQVNAGANTDVDVTIGNTTADDVLAVLKIDGNVVASEDFELVD